MRFAYSGASRVRSYGNGRRRFHRDGLRNRKELKPKIESFVGAQFIAPDFWFNLSLWRVAKGEGNGNSNG
jgi:hypothetical protein